MAKSIHVTVNLRTADTFNEAAHKRDHGKFASTGGGPKDPKHPPGFVPHGGGQGKFDYGGAPSHQAMRLSRQAATATNKGDHPLAHELHYKAQKAHRTAAEHHGNILGNKPLFDAHMKMQEHHSVLAAHHDEKSGGSPFAGAGAEARGRRNDEMLPAAKKAVSEAARLHKPQK